MCAVSEISCRAKEFASALLTDGYITDEQYPAVYGRVKEQLALCTAAMMAEVRLRCNAIVQPAMAVEQITRETMTYISTRQQEMRKRRKDAVRHLRNMAPPPPPEQVELPANVKVKVVDFDGRFPEAPSDVWVRIFNRSTPNERRIMFFRNRVVG